MIVMLKKAYKGFTFIEIMIAILIIAVSIIPILNSCGLSLTLSSRTRDIITSTILANSLMAEIQTEGFPSIGLEEGDFGKDYPRFSWRKKVEEGPIENLRIVEVEVFYKDGETERSTTLTTFIARKE